MKILVTGASGFIGKSLVCALKNIKEGKDRTRPNLCVESIYEYDVDSGDLKTFCSDCDFVFNFAGINRPKNASDFKKGNIDFVTNLIQCLENSKNYCPIMLSSSIQASLIGIYNSEYGKSKRTGEEIVYDYSERTGAEAFVFRFPNVFGKWCKPNYNSVVATFCYNIANDLPVNISNPSTVLELLYIDDLVASMLDLLEGKVCRCTYDGLHPLQNSNGKYCYVPHTHQVSLGEIVKLLELFSKQPETLLISEASNDSFEKKLYTTYISYLPFKKTKVSLKMNRDSRGSFTELIKTTNCGQFSVNVSNPGITKGQHWHNSKWELFIVVYGHGLIKERKIGTDEIMEFYVSGENIDAVYMLPGYTHSIINLSDTDPLVTLMWANECFDNDKPDTYYEEL